jgi:hypothetical protein
MCCKQLRKQFWLTIWSEGSNFLCTISHSQRNINTLSKLELARHACWVVRVKSGPASCYDTRKEIFIVSDLTLEFLTLKTCHCFCSSASYRGTTYVDIRRIFKSSRIFAGTFHTGGLTWQRLPKWHYVGLRWFCMFPPVCTLQYKLNSIFNQSYSISEPRKTPKRRVTFPWNLSWAFNASPMYLS